MKVRKLFLMLFIAVPLIVMILVGLLAGIFQLKRDIAVSANTLLRFSADISAASWQVAGKAARLAESSCTDSLKELSRTRAFTPYVRDIGFLENGDITCSFVTGTERYHFSRLAGLSLPASYPERWLRSIGSMAEGPDRLVVVYVKKVAANKAAFVIVDSQYVQELIEILAAERASAFSLTFGAGEAITSAATLRGKAFLTQRFTSTDHTIQLMVRTPFSTLSAYWLQNLFIFVPLSLCLSVGMMLFYRRWYLKRLSLAREIARGITHNEFTVHYQPVFNVKHGSCGGVEALMRWPQPDGRFITPDIFITAAENEGMIIPLSRHLFELIAHDVINWTVTDDFYISVNISPAHLMDDGFIQDIEALRTRLGTITLMLELTERSLIVEPSQVAEKLSTLREKGVLIAIDDFGTGYCSLSYLQQLPVDSLKIDRTFIDTIDTSSNDVPVLDTIITLSQRLGLNVVAEGVSTQHQLRYILSHGVGFLQGFLYARPMEANDFMSWLGKSAQRQNGLLKGENESASGLVAE
ncbi:EAL domain-containing protein [Salmonella enterica subsp. enterica serovar Anderlecht]|nr:EAL domain-containing protein [Salmonella enterica subsp. enterica serovar Anderlecht]EEJ3527163.1 EAL domain-containing protein [Salmonella enterica subsp. enterica serovar Anderlecht]MIX10034.1 cyclic diguanylate phosphodiesterase [Salmonella enterica subsp. enterica serovar Anderlecht]